MAVEDDSARCCDVRAFAFGTQLERRSRRKLRATLLNGRREVDAPEVDAPTEGAGSAAGEMGAQLRRYRRLGVLVEGSGEAPPEGTEADDLLRLRSERRVLKRRLIASRLEITPGERVAVGVVGLLSWIARGAGTCVGNAVEDSGSDKGEEEISMSESWNGAVPGLRGPACPASTGELNGEVTLEGSGTAGIGVARDGLLRTWEDWRREFA